MSFRLKIMSLFCILTILFSVTPVFAEEDRPEADLSVSMVSQYIWRGQELSRDSLVFQPSATFSYKGFSANLWLNFDTDPFDKSSVDNLNEVDHTISYGHEFGKFSAEIGYIYYSLPGFDDSQEVFVSGLFDTFLAPCITVYQEFAHYNHTYITLGVSHSIELPKSMSLDLGLQGSYLVSQDKGAYPDPDDSNDEFSNFHDGIASAAINIPMSSFFTAQAANYFSVTPEIYWVFPMSGDASKDMAQRSVNSSGKNNFVYGGVTFSMSF